MNEDAVAHDPRLRAAVAEHPYSLLFATISAAHLYGFPSPDSDFDLRGAHVLPAAEVLGLLPLRETIESSGVRDGMEMDLVTHDVRKFFRLMQRPNGYVLEQLHSPLVVHTTPEHAELVAIAKRCVTRHHAHHYLGFADTQWKLFTKESPRRVKPLLYVYRVLLTGIHLMRTGQIEANLRHLNTEARLAHVDDLIARKAAGPEQGTLSEADSAFHESEFNRLRLLLEDLHRACALPEYPSGEKDLNELLVRLRMKC